jgi:ComF family protein
MKLDFAVLWDILFPLSDDERILEHIDVAAFASKYDPHETREGTIALSSFKDPEVRAAIHLVKFHAHKKSAELLNSLLQRYLNSLPEDTYLIIPIPLSAKRQRERGHNQVLTVLQHIVNTRYEISSDTLLRRVHTTPQSGLKKQERMRNLRNAFLYKEKNHLLGKHIIILDDVITTGSTLREAKNALRESGAASIRTVAIAH